LAPIESLDGGTDELVESVPAWARNFATSASNAAICVFARANNAVNSATDAASSS
jgi:hypothetical protein